MSASSADPVAFARAGVAELHATLMAMPEPEEILLAVPRLAAAAARLESLLPGVGAEGGVAVSLKLLKLELSTVEKLIDRALGFYSSWGAMLGVASMGYGADGRAAALSPRRTMSVCG